MSGIAISPSVKEIFNLLSGGGQYRRPLLVLEDNGYSFKCIAVRTILYICIKQKILNKKSSIIIPYSMTMDE
jgi:hypothetical protein